MLATAMLRDSELGHAAVCLVSYLWLWGTVATMCGWTDMPAGSYIWEWPYGDTEWPNSNVSIQA